MVHFVLVWKSSKYSCLSSFPSKQSFNNRKLCPRDKQDDSIKTTLFTSSKQFEETWKLEAGVMCRKNLNLQGRKSFMKTYMYIQSLWSAALTFIIPAALWQPPKPQHGLLSPVRSEQGEEEDQKALHSGIGPEEWMTSVLLWQVHWTEKKCIRAPISDA